MNVYILIFIILILGLFYSFTMSIVKKEKDTNEPIQEGFKNSDKKENKLQDFIPSNSFDGEKKGYVFKNDKKGLGYYLDTFYK